MLNLNKNKLIPATEIIAYWGEIKGDISKQTDLVELTTDLDTSIKGWVESKGYVTAETLPEGIATESWVQSQGYLTEHQDLSGYALKTEIPSLDGYATESWVSNQGYITSVPDTFATKNWVSAQGYLTEHQDLTGYATESWVEAIIINKEDKKPVFYIDVDFDGPSVKTSYADYMSIGAQIKQLGVDNVVLYVRDTALDLLNIPDSVEISGSNFTIEGYAYNNFVYRIEPVTSSSKVQINFNILTTYNTMTSNINDVKTWVVNQNYAKKTELKTINGQSIVGSGDITIQATGGITEEWLQNNLKTINGESLIGGGNLAVQSPIEIGIDIDSGQFIGTYDDYKALVDEYANDGGYTRKLMIYLGADTVGREYSSYPSDVEYCPDGKIEIGGYFLDDRDENNKKLVYYRIKGNDATQTVDISLTPVSSGGDIPSLDGYATQEWVSNQLSNYTTNSDFTSLQNRVVALETNYGDALNITNQILG